MLRTTRQARTKRQFLCEPLEQRLLLAADAFEIDDQLESASPIDTTGLAQAHTIHHPQDVDWVRFTLSQPSRVVIETSGTEGDTEMTLFGYNSLIAHDDDSGAGNFSRIVAYLNPSTYWIRIVEGDQEAVIDAYHVTAESTPFSELEDAYEEDDSSGQATPLVSGAPPQQHSLHQLEDADWYSFHLDERSTIVFSVLVDRESIGATRTRLYAAGEVDPIADSARDEMSGELEAGDYFIVVSELGTDEVIANYSVEFHATPLANLTGIWGAVDDAHKLLPGDSVTLTWRVTNDGAGPTYAAGRENITWTDRVYLSHDNQLGDDVYLGQVNIQQQVQRGDVYKQSMEIRIPNALEWAGRRAYLLIDIDSDSRLWELDESDNLLITPLTIRPNHEILTPSKHQWVDNRHPVEFLWLAGHASSQGSVSVFVDDDANPHNGIGHHELFTEHAPALDPDELRRSATLAMLTPRAEPYFVWSRFESPGLVDYSEPVPIYVRDEVAQSQDELGDTFGGSGYEVFGVTAAQWGKFLHFRIQTDYDPEKPYSGNSTGGGDVRLRVGNSIYGIAVNTHSLDGSDGEVVAGNLYTGASFLPGTMVSSVPTFINDYEQVLSGRSWVNYIETPDRPWAYEIVGGVDLSALADFRWGDTVAISWAMYCGNDTDDVVITPEPVPQQPTAGDVDITVTDLNWDRNGGDLNFSYSIAGDSLSVASSAGLYWSSGQTAEDVIGMPIDEWPLWSDAGDYGPLTVSADQLSDPPVDAMYLLIVADLENRVDETNENNNLLVLALDAATVAGDALFEFMSREVVYLDSWMSPDDWRQSDPSRVNDPGQPVRIYDTANDRFIDTSYVVDQVFGTGANATGFYALGLKSASGTPMLVLRGTEPTDLNDIITDLDFRGVGQGQFLTYRAVLFSWLRTASSGGQVASLTGHSLGGALAQLVAAGYTSQNGAIGQLVTFNSPGISQQDADQFCPEASGRVMHYIANGDLVSMAGEAYLEGSYKLASYDDWNIFNKHVSPMLLDRIVRTEYDRPGDLTLSSADPVDWLNNPYYFHTDVNYLGWLAALRLSAEALFPQEYRNLPGWLLFRSTTEQARGEFGRWAHLLASALSPNPNLHAIEVTVPEIEVNLFDALTIKATDLKAHLSQAGGNPTLRMEGKVELPTFYKITADFSEPNYLQYSMHGGWEMRGRVSAEDLGLPIVPGVLTLQDMYLEFATGQSLPSNTAQQPHEIECGQPASTAGIQPEDVLGGQPPTSADRGSMLRGGATVSTALDIDFTAGLGFYQGEPNYLGVGVDDLGTPIGTTGLFLQCFAGHVEHFAPSDPQPASITPQVGVTVGPSITIRLPGWAGGSLQGALAEINLQGTMTAEHIVAAGNVSLLGGLGTGDGQIELNWQQGFVQVDGRVHFLGNLITADTSFRVDSNQNLSLLGSATVTLPSIAYTPLRGQQLSSGNVAIQYTNDGSLANDYLAAWGTYHVPLWGPVTLGFKVTFDNDWSLIGDVSELEPDSTAPLLASHSSASAEQSYTIAPGTERMMFFAEWEHAHRTADWELVDPSGRTYRPSDVNAATNMAVLTPFTFEGSTAVGISNPQPGVWTVRLRDADDLGATQLRVYASSTTPTLSIHDVEHNGETATIHFDAVVPDSSATVRFYYDDDRSGADGTYIGTVAEADGEGSLQWNVPNVSSGRFYVYAIVDDGRHQPVVVYADSEHSIVIGNVCHNSALPADVNHDQRISPLDAILVINHFSQPSGQQAGAATYCLDVTDDGFISPLDAIRVINHLGQTLLPLNSDPGVPAAASNSSAAVALVVTPEMLNKLSPGQVRDAVFDSTSQWHASATQQLPSDATAGARFPRNDSAGSTQMPTLRKLVQRHHVEDHRAMSTSVGESSLVDSALEDYGTEFLSPFNFRYIHSPVAQLNALHALGRRRE